MDHDRQRERDGLDVVTERVLKCAYAVANGLGAGFLEKVYENALAVEMAGEGLEFGQQVGMQVLYKGEVVGDYIADFIVEGCVVVELKVAHALDAVHEAQVLNYLRATGHKVGLLLNFARPKLEIKRLVSKF